MALPGAALPLTGCRCDAVSRPDRRRADCPGQSDRRCNNASGQHRRFTPAVAAPSLPVPDVGTCIARCGNRSRRWDGTTCPIQCLQVEPVPTVRPGRPWRRRHGLDHLRRPADRDRRLQRADKDRHHSTLVNPPGRWLPYGTYWSPVNIAGSQTI